MLNTSSASSKLEHDLNKYGIHNLKTHIHIISFSFKFIYYPELKQHKPKTWEAFFMAVLIFSPEQESGTHSPTVSGRFEYCNRGKKKL